MGLNVVDTLNAHTKKGLPISEIASEILWQQLNSADGHTLGPIKVTATTLAALAIFADMIDGFIEAETGRRSSRVRKSWQARQRRLLRMFTAEVSRDVRINAAKISSDFRISLGRSVGADAMAQEMKAICLALIHRYPGREGFSDEYKHAQSALGCLIEEWDDVV